MLPSLCSLTIKEKIVCDLPVALIIVWTCQASAKAPEGFQILELIGMFTCIGMDLQVVQVKVYVFLASVMEIEAYGIVVISHKNA